MATGQSHRIPRGNAMVTYTEYKLQPSDAGKDLKRIARERLNDENLYKDILRMLEAPNTQGRPWYAEIVQKDRIGSDWTLLLPPAKAIPPQPAPSDLATFKIISKANVRTSPKLDPGNIHFVGPIGTIYTYKRSSMITDANGMVWVDVTPSNLPRKASGATYWMCVREGSIHHTDPYI